MKTRLIRRQPKSVKSQSSPRQTSVQSHQADPDLDPQAIQRIVSGEMPHAKPDAILQLQRQYGNQYVQRLVAQQRSSGPAISRASQAHIQRRLDGLETHLSSISQGQTGRFGYTSTWHDIIEAIKKYNKAAADRTNVGSSRSRKNTKKFFRNLHKILQTIDSLLVKYINKNNEKGVNDPKKKKQIFAAVFAQRRVFLELNLVNNALDDLDKGPIPDPKMLDIGLSDNVIGEYQDNAVGGNMSTLDRGNWQGFGEGYFQPDKESDNGSDASESIGIPQNNPNYGGRAVAMKQIDNLINSKIEQAFRMHLIVDTQFAIHKRTPILNGKKEEAVATTGIVLKSAQGQELRSGYLDSGNTSDQKQGGLDLNDPVFQQSLNRMQILDVICGQVDRHAANIFVKMDGKGGVSTVEGIDNDLAFGKKQSSIDKNDSVNKTLGKSAWRGMPPIADKIVAEAVLSITPEMIEKALSGIINLDEIEATISRLKSAQQFLKSLKNEDLIEHDQWVKEKDQLAKKQTDENSYLGAYRKEYIGGLAWKIMDEHTKTIVERVKPFIQAGAAGALAKVLRDKLIPKVVAGEISVDKLDGIVENIIAGYTKKAENESNNTEFFVGNKLLPMNPYIDSSGAALDYARQFVDNYLTTL